MNHLAIDVETLSLRENAHILSIGAAFFCPRSKKIGHSFHVVVDMGVEQKGAHISASTVAWWFGQNVARDGLLIGEQLELGEALRFFCAWIDRHVTPNTDLKIYQQGSLDSLWLNNAGARNGVKMPWMYQNVFCARTLWAHAGDTPVGFVDYDGVEHNALDDAFFVANRMLEVVK